MSIAITKTGLLKTEDFYESSSISFSGLPSTYTQLEYLESSGTQQIDCGFKLNPETDSFRIKFRTVTADNGMIFANVSGKYFWLYDYKNNNSNTIYTNCNGGSQIYIYNAPIDTGVDHICYYNNRSSYYDGPLKGTFSSSVNTTTSSNMYLFSRQDVNYYKGRIYYLEVWSNGLLTHHLIPAKNSSDVLGMYDLCKGTFLTNSGTGNFTTGTTLSNHDSQIVANDFIEV